MHQVETLLEQHDGRGCADEDHAHVRQREYDARLQTAT